MILGFSCGNVKRVDTTEMKQLIKDSKIRKITDAEIVSKANSIGLALRDSLANNLEYYCSQKISNNNYKLELQNFNVPFKSSFPKITEVFENYKLAHLNNQLAPENIQKINDTLIVFSFPISKSWKNAQKCDKQLALIYLNKRQIVQAFESIKK